MFHTVRGALQRSSFGSARYYCSNQFNGFSQINAEKTAKVAEFSTKFNTMSETEQRELTNNLLAKFNVNSRDANVVDKCISEAIRGNGYQEVPLVLDYLKANKRYVNDPQTLDDVVNFSIETNDIETGVDFFESAIETKKVNYVTAINLVAQLDNNRGERIKQLIKENRDNVISSDDNSVEILTYHVLNGETEPALKVVDMLAAEKPSKNSLDLLLAVYAQAGDREGFATTLSSISNSYGVDTTTIMGVLSSGNAEIIQEYNDVLFTAENKQNVVEALKNYQKDPENTEDSRVQVKNLIDILTVPANKKE